KVAGYRANKKGVVAHRERAAGRESGDAGSSPACETPYLRHHLPIETLDGPLSLGYCKRATASGCESRAIWQQMFSQLDLCPSLYLIGPIVVGYLTQMEECRTKIELGKHLLPN